ncbi:leucyl aminopeptidase [Aquabacterium sp. A7-Y]|uniref:leucyl aminopeptidase n=1 Tax=Aquabacterium sp. A7-Y TaxID=1349605 RepID=UPI00223DEFC7|nr:leucyl aminopeptidase [Aquabacterium sp. A7-Y]MCW7537865.1 leucyl aminopeptidase [Aquabacterium sp. A7-Y]
MDFKFAPASRAALAELSCDALIVIVTGDASSQGLDGALAQQLKDALAQKDFQLKAGRTLYLHRPQGVKAPRVVLAAAADAGPKALRAALGNAAGVLKNSGAKHVAVAPAAGAALTAEHAEAVVAALADASYVYRHTKPSAPPAAGPARVSLLGEKADAKAVQQGLARGQAIAAGVTLARECANRPGNHCTPSFLAEQARSLAKEHGLKVEVLDRKAVEKLGMGAFLAVSQGSEEPLRFIVLRYDGAPRTQAPVVLVGKGITFDTGGISIKPAAEMDEMKFDMGGAASVLGTFRAVAELKPRINLVGVIPACENMPDGRAVKPGDVVTSMSGQTIEILNTDAEGRLILCDALTYVERFKPAAVVDIATLTGACVVALGNLRTGLFCADDELAEALLDSGRQAQDLAWRMPLDEEYEEALKSNFADMGNVGGRAGGAITAAMFLRKFTSKYRWAHLDIAGTAWKGGGAKGATGRPVPLLTHFVLGQAR